MRTRLILILSLFWAQCMFVNAQIPNGSFENWSSTSYLQPEVYIYNSTLEAYFSECPFNVEQATDAQDGQYAVKLTTYISTEGDDYFGYILNTDPEEGNVPEWTNGTPYSEIPTGVHGYYKYNVVSGDSAVLITSFRKSGNTIGTYINKMGGIKSTYTEFNFTFSPALTEAPDSIIFGAVSSDFINNTQQDGSTLYLDNITFSGVTSQPDLNNNFELWTTEETPLTIDNWNNSQSRGFTRVTDAKDGLYAIQLISYLDEDNENGSTIIKTNPGYVTNGYWDNDDQTMKGGIPFDNQIDTLTLWYKYTPVSGSKGQVYTMFIKDGTQFDGRVLNLDASTDYQYVELPFGLQQTPDSIIINFISSAWDDTDVTYAGATLIVDDVIFKSEMETSVPTYNLSDNIIIKEIRKGYFRIDNLDYSNYTVMVNDMAGHKVISEKNITDIDLTANPPGVYIINIQIGNSTFSRKILR